MRQALSPELYWLTLTALMTATFWIPYILQLVAQMRIGPALWDRYHETPHEARWAQRGKRAHINAVENLAVFAPLVLMLHEIGYSTPTTVTATKIYFFARAAHYVIYVLAVPVLRTLSFFVGFLMQVTLAFALLGLA